MIKIFEMFSGYGGASFALKKANIPFECIGYSEIDKYAIRCFNQNFPNVKNYGDCTKINPEELPDFDLLTGGFPCQSFSIAGKRKGIKDSRGTLFYEIIRVAKIKKPRYMLLENVKGLLSIDNGETFKEMIKELKNIGYDIIYKVLNSKNYGIPQNRERVWFVCKFGKWEFNEFQFPEKEELKIFIKNILEESPNKKYYLSELMQKRFKEYLEKKKPNESIYLDFKTKSGDKVANTIRSGSGSGNTPMVYDRKGFDSRTKGFRENELSPTLSTKMGTGGNNVPMISNASPREVGFKEISPSLLSRDYKDPKIVSGNLRRLTPRECFRLMGFLNDEINLNGLSDTQCYKLAGNGWDVNLVSKIFKRMFDKK